MRGGSSKTVTVTFAPTVAKSYNDTLTVKSNATFGISSLQIFGTGTNISQPQMTITSPLVVADKVTQGRKNHILYKLNLTGAILNTTLTGLSVKTAGTYQTSDISYFKLYYSTDDTFETGDLLMSTKTSAASGSSILFSGFTKTISSGTTGYLFITADVAENAVTGGTVGINAVSFADISVAESDAVKSGTTPLPAGGLQTIILSQGIIVSKNALLITASGGTAKFIVSLSSVPTSAVNIGMYSANTDTGVCAISPANITLTSGNANTGVEVSVTDMNGSSGKNHCDIAFNPAVSSDTYFNGMKPEMISVNIFQTPDLATAKRKKAIIIAGGGFGYTGDYLWQATKFCTDQANAVLQFQGYEPSNIMYFSADSTNPYKDTTADNLSRAITQWAAQPSGGYDVNELLIYMTGHGTSGSFTLKGSQNLTLTADVIKGWLDTLQNANNGIRVILIYDACYSGSFTDRLKKNYGAAYERIIITSAGAGQVALFGDNGKISFSAPFWNAVMTQGMLNGSFKSAEANMVKMRLPQLAKLTDMPASDIKIGMGLQQASSLININTISPKQTLSCNISNATVQVRDIVPSNEIQSVNVRVAYNELDKMTDTSLIDPLLTKAQNTDPANPVYEGTFDVFSQKGTYNVCVFAQNMNNKDSEWICTLVEQPCISAVKGDLNGIGGVDLADAILALKVLAGLNVSVNTSGDVNSDNKIGLEEVVYILQKVAGLR